MIEGIRIFLSFFMGKSIILCYWLCPAGESEMKIGK